MPVAEYDTGHQPGQGDVGGGGNGPAVGYGAEVVAAAVEHQGQQQEQPRRAEDAAQGAHQRVDGFGQGVQRAAGQHRLGNLLGGDAEEEDHENFVDQEVNGDVLAEDVEVVGVVAVVFQVRPLAEVPEVELHQLVVAVEVNVGPHQPGDDADDEGQGVFLEERDKLAYLRHWKPLET